MLSTRAEARLGPCAVPEITNAALRTRGSGGAPHGIATPSLSARGPAALLVRACAEAAKLVVAERIRGAWARSAAASSEQAAAAVPPRRLPCPGSCSALLGAMARPAGVRRGCDAWLTPVEHLRRACPAPGRPLVGLSGAAQRKRKAAAIGRTQD
eukprot:scaffold2201_cov110-Isochrysis_galbana.AAC.4